MKETIEFYTFSLSNRKYGIILNRKLKALKIIKEKCVDVGWLIRSKNYSKYNLGVGSKQALKKSEYDLLKEVLL